MSPEGGSVSRWFGPLRDGDPAAAQQLWERYFQRLIELARKKLRDLPHREAAEDVALSAFDSFCRSAGLARFPQLADRDSLWRLLVVVTARKAAHHKRDERRQKRGGFNAGAGPMTTKLGRRSKRLSGVSRRPSSRRKQPRNASGSCTYSAIPSWRRSRS